MRTKLSSLSHSAAPFFKPRCRQVVLVVVYILLKPNLKHLITLLSFLVSLYSIILFTVSKV